MLPQAAPCECPGCKQLCSQREAGCVQARKQRQGEQSVLVQSADGFKITQHGSKGKKRKKVAIARASLWPWQLISLARADTKEMQY